MTIQLQVLLLIGTANFVPIIAGRILAARFDHPLDGGLKFPDGNPLLGPSKTVRGIVFSIIVTALVAPILSFSWGLGASIALFAMVGDVTSSFIKRRLNRPPSSMAPGIDQIPECLFPLLVVREQLALTGWDMVLVVAAFVILEALLSPLLFKLHIRNRPY